MVLHNTSAFIESCARCPIGRHAVCARCDTAEVDELEGVKFYRHFEPDQPLILAGDEMEYVASIVTGLATLTHTMEDGRRSMVGLLQPSDFMGRPGRTKAIYDVTAITSMVLCCFQRKPFEALLQAMPHLGKRLLEMSLDELDAAREWMLLLGCKTAREKVASLLVMVARRDATHLGGADPNNLAFELRLTRLQMSEYLGLTEETVSRQISALKRDGVIAIKGLRAVRVPNFRRLLEEKRRRCRWRDHCLAMPFVLRVNDRRLGHQHVVHVGAGHGSLRRIGCAAATINTTEANVYASARPAD